MFYLPFIINKEINNKENNNYVANGNGLSEQIEHAVPLRLTLYIK